MGYTDVVDILAHNTNNSPDPPCYAVWYLYKWCTTCALLVEGL